MPRRYQPRIGYQHSTQIAAVTHDKIKEAVIRDSIRWNCSESWIIATALAAFYNIDIVTPFPQTKKKIKMTSKEYLKLVKVR